MATPAANLERAQLLKIAEEYQAQGYEVLFGPGQEDLPDFLKHYRLDMIARRSDESVIVEVKSRSSLPSPSTQYFSNLAQVVKEHPGWRFELVMTNPENAAPLPQGATSLQEHEIKSRLQVVPILAQQHPESAFLYAWSLTEATLRLIAEQEELDLERFDSLYLVKRLTAEGIISQASYQALMSALTLRNAIAHGFQVEPVTAASVSELMGLTEQLLSALNSDDAGV